MKYRIYELVGTNSDNNTEALRRIESLYVDEFKTREEALEYIIERRHSLSEKELVIVEVIKPSYL